MKNTLLDKGIILPSGEINKDKINLVAGAITQPFAEMVWVTTGGDMETVNRLTDVLVTMNTPADRGKLFKIIKMLYGLMGLPFSEEAEPMGADPAVLEYFLFSFTADFGEVIQDIIADVLNVSKDDIHPETTFVDDLGADSLDIFQIIMGIEEEFDIEIDNDEAEKISTVQDAVDQIKKVVE